MFRIYTLMASVWILLATVFPVAATEPLPDTKVQKCYSDLQLIICPYEGEPFYGQDAHYQVSRSGYINHLDETVSDTVTDLRWDKSDSGTPLTWQDAVEYCTGRGASLPTLFQLETLIDYTRKNPAVNSDLFSSTQPNGLYWSETFTPNPFGTDFAWYINFYEGHSGSYDKDQLLYARCVRGDWDVGLGAFTDNANGTVTDIETGLTWQADKGAFKDWKDALAYCEGLSLAEKNWRLPNIRELRSIVDPHKGYPAIDTDFFQAEPVAYWSATTSADPNAANIAWSVEFDQGRAWTTEGSKSTYHWVRCVAHEPFKLEVEVSPKPEFKVTSEPDGIDCGEDCSEYFTNGTKVTLTVSHELIEEFDCEWLGISCLGADPYPTCVIQRMLNDVKVSVVCSSIPDNKPVDAALNYLLLME